jgi:hypothetical protein
MLVCKHYLLLVLNGKNSSINLRFFLFVFFRYISIIHPMKISRISRRNRLYLIFIFIWSLGFIAALPNLYLLKLHPFYNRPQYYICGLSDHSINSHFIRFYKYTESVFFFFLPAFIQVSLNTFGARQTFLS